MDSHPRPHASFAQGSLAGLEHIDAVTLLNAVHHITLFVTLNPRLEVTQVDILRRDRSPVRFWLARADVVITGMALTCIALEFAAKSSARVAWVSLRCSLALLVGWPWMAR